MRAIMKAPGTPAHTVIIPNDPDLFRQIVGGWLEEARLTEDLVILCDEEGRLKNYPYNCEICGRIFVGTILLVGADGEDFTDVPVAALEALEEGRLL